MLAISNNEMLFTKLFLFWINDLYLDFIKCSKQI